MRKNLFRGEPMIRPGFVEGYLVVCDERYFIMPKDAVSCFFNDGIHPGTYVFGEFVEVSPPTVGQCTELPDKNGRMIFDGDILKESDIKIKDEDEEIQISGRIWQVTMAKGVWCVRNKHEWDFLSSNAHHCEVIGNIHDNPELLEGKA